MKSDLKRENAEIEHCRREPGDPDTAILLAHHAAPAPQLQRHAHILIRNGGQEAGSLANVTGLTVALAAQVPYSAILLTTYELVHRTIEDQDASFNRYD